MLGVIGAVLLLLSLPNMARSNNDEENAKKEKELEDIISDLNETLYFFTGNRDSGTNFAKWLDQTISRFYWAGLTLCLVQIGINIYSLL